MKDGSDVFSHPRSTGVVGTPEQVAEAMGDCYDLGISTLLIRGFDPLVNAIEYGRELLARVRERVQARDAGIASRQAAA